MGPFGMVVLIVLIVGIVKIVQARHGVAPGVGDGGSPVITARTAADAERLHAELRQLRDRVAVIERIVTDGDHARGLALSREIEALREEREPRP